MNDFNAPHLADMGLIDAAGNAAKAYDSRGRENSTENINIRFERFDCMTFHVYTDHGRGRAYWKHVGTVQDRGTGSAWHAFNVNGNQMTTEGTVATRDDAARLLA